MNTALFCLAMVVYFESRSEPLYSQYMVAEVVMNRVESKRYPNEVCDVMRQSKQFSFYDESSRTKIHDKKSWNIAKTVAKKTLESPFNYGLGCHYHRVDVKPHWARSFKRVIKSGKHLFYKGGC